MIRSRPTIIQLSAKDVNFDTYDLLMSRVIPRSQRRNRYLSAPDSPAKQSEKGGTTKTVIGDNDDGNATTPTATLHSKHIVASPSCSPQPPEIESDDPIRRRLLQLRSSSLEFPIFDDKDIILSEPVSAPSLNTSLPSMTADDDTEVQDEDVSFSGLIDGDHGGNGSGRDHDNDDENDPNIEQGANGSNMQSPVMASVPGDANAWPEPIVAETYADAGYGAELPSPVIEIPRPRPRRLGFSLSLLRRRNRNRTRRSTR